MAPKKDDYLIPLDLAEYEILAGPGKFDLICEALGGGHPVSFEVRSLVDGQTLVLRIFITGMDSMNTISRRDWQISGYFEWNGVPGTCTPFEGVYRIGGFAVAGWRQVRGWIRIE
ncbi:MAG: hypothetical protein AAB729_02185 [Patescibacteria group bacterium]